MLLNLKAVLVCSMLALSSATLINAYNCECAIISPIEQAAESLDNVTKFIASPGCQILESKLEYSREHGGKWPYLIELLKHSPMLKEQLWDDPERKAQIAAKVKHALNDTSNRIKCHDRPSLHHNEYPGPSEILTVGFFFLIIFVLCVELVNAILTRIGLVKPTPTSFPAEKSTVVDEEKGGLYITLDEESDTDSEDLVI